MAVPIDPKKVKEIFADRPPMRHKDIEQLLDTISDAILEGRDLELPLHMLAPEEGSNEREAGLLTIPQEILDHVEERGGALEDHILGYLEAMIDLHNEGVLLKVMVQLSNAAQTDDYRELADETGTGIKPNIKALFGFLIEHDAEGRKIYEDALNDIKHSLLKSAAFVGVPENAKSWRELLPIKENSKCHECGAILNDSPFLVLMGALVSPTGKVVYGDGFADDSDSPPGLELRRGIPVCLECLRAHLDSTIVERMATLRAKPSARMMIDPIRQALADRAKEIILKVGNPQEQPENGDAEQPQKEAPQPHSEIEEAEDTSGVPKWAADAPKG